MCCIYYVNYIFVSNHDKYRDLLIAFFTHTQWQIRKLLCQRIWKLTLLLLWFQLLPKIITSAFPISRSPLPLDKTLGYLLSQLGCAFHALPQPRSTKARSPNARRDLDPRSLRQRPPPQHSQANACLMSALKEARGHGKGKESPPAP